MRHTSLSALAWSAPRLVGSDFTPEDPLAIDHLQQQVGNRLWPGFTTRTSRAFYFVMVCYGVRLADELLPAHGLAPTDENRRRLFERWEKLWALGVAASHDGNIPTDDGLRGRNGVIRAWRSRAGRLPLDYTLISRQLELGALGAYRTSLVEHGLLQADALLPTPLGAALAQQMWGDDKQREALDGLVRASLAPDRTEAVAEMGQIGFSTYFGPRCRLSRVRQRPDLQALIAARLFEGHPPPLSLKVLPEMARMLSAAHAAGVRDARGFLEGVSAGRWGPASPEATQNARIGVVFGDLASAMRAAFDGLYAAVVDGGERTPLAEAARAALPDEPTASHLQACLEAWRAEPTAARFIREQAHGGAFAAAADALDSARSLDVVHHLLDLHRRVQAARGKSRPWVSVYGDQVVAELASYRSWHLDPHVWVVTYKHGAMTELLRDLGRVGAS